MPTATTSDTTIDSEISTDKPPTLPPIPPRTARGLGDHGPNFSINVFLLVNGTDPASGAVLVSQLANSPCGERARALVGASSRHPGFAEELYLVLGRARFVVHGRSGQGMIYEGREPDGVRFVAEIANFLYSLNDTASAREAQRALSSKAATKPQADRGDIPVIDRTANAIVRHAEKLIPEALNHEGRAEWIGAIYQVVADVVNGVEKSSRQAAENIALATRIYLGVKTDSALTNPISVTLSQLKR